MHYKVGVQRFLRDVIMGEEENKCNDARVTKVKYIRDSLLKNLVKLEKIQVNIDKYIAECNYFK